MNTKLIVDDKKIKCDYAEKKWLLGCAAAGEFIDDDFDPYAHKTNFAKAITYWKDAANRGNPQAQCELAWCYAHGFFVEKDIEKSFEWYKKSSEQNFFSAYLELVSLCFENKIDSENLELIISCFRSAINIMYQPRQSILNWDGYWHTNITSDADMDNVTADRFHRHSKYMSLGIISGANKGIPEAQFLMGVWTRYNLFRSYSSDKYCLENKELSKKWYSLAAAQNLSVAEYELGKMLDSEKKYEQAFNFYLRAAKKHWKLPMLSLAYCYKNGIGVEIDLKKSFEYYSIFAQKGDA